MSTRKHEPEELTDLAVWSLRSVLIGGTDASKVAAARLVLERIAAERKAIASFEARLAALEKEA